MCTLRTFYLQVDGFLPQFSVQLHFLNPLTLVPSAQWNTSSIQFFLCGNFQKNLFVGRFHWLQTTLSKIQMCIIQLIVLYEVYLWGIIQQFICVKNSTRRPNKIPKIIQEKNFKVNNSQRRQQIICRSFLVKSGVVPALDRDRATKNHSRSEATFAGKTVGIPGCRQNRGERRRSSRLSALPDWALSKALIQRDKLYFMLCFLYDDYNNI